MRNGKVAGWPGAVVCMIQHLRAYQTRRCSLQHVTVPPSVAANLPGLYYQRCEAAVAAYNLRVSKLQGTISTQERLSLPRLV